MQGNDRAGLVYDSVLTVSMRVEVFNCGGVNSSHLLTKVDNATFPDTVAITVDHQGAKVRIVKFLSLLTILGSHLRQCKKSSLKITFHAYLSCCLGVCS